MIATRAMALVLALLTTATVSADPFAWTVNSDDEFSADQLLRVDLATGAFEFVGPLPSFLNDVEGLAIDAEGRLFAVDNSSKTLVTVDTTTAEAQAISSRQSNLGFRPTQALDFGLTFACDGRLLMVAEQTESLYSVDINTGQALVIGESGGLGAPMTAIASFGREVVALAAETNGLYRIDDDQGTASLITTINGYDITDAGLSFDPTGILWAVIDGSGVTDDGNPMFNPSPVLRIDLSTGEILQVATTRTGIESLAITSPGSCDQTLGFPGPAIVPTLSPLGLLVLIMLLALLGRSRLPAYLNR